MSRFLLGLFIFSLSVTANALPLPKPGMMVPPPSLTDDYNFEGIVALINCSGSLIQFEGAKDTDHALVLTNGHCLETGFPKPGQFVHDQASSATFDVENPASDKIGKVTATEVVYSTMTDTDITIYQLQETYAEIKSKFNVRPFTLASKKPDVGQPIQVISGFWQQGYSCNVEAFVYELHEDAWTWKDSIRYSRPGCEVIGGTSGSPVVATGTRTVVAVNNTINEDGDKCTFDNPCEVDNHGGVSFQKGYGYAEETYLIYSCVNAYRQFDLTTPGCRLPH